MIDKDVIVKKIQEEKSAGEILGFPGKRGFLAEIEIRACLGPFLGSGGWGGPGPGNPGNPGFRGFWGVLGGSPGGPKNPGFPGFRPESGRGVSGAREGAAWGGRNPGGVGGARGRNLQPLPGFGGFSGCRGPFNKCIFRSGFGVFLCAAAVWRGVARCGGFWGFSGVFGVWGVLGGFGRMSKSDISSF
jgi:hypothetical protein